MQQMLLKSDIENKKKVVVLDNVEYVIYLVLPDTVRSSVFVEVRDVSNR